MIFHEALHGFTGKYDDVIQKALSLNKNALSGVIDVFIQNHMLKYSAGLDEWIESPCPTLFAALSDSGGLDRASVS
jgi:hypothetical protein